jgi:hypothetical protein
MGSKMKGQSIESIGETSEHKFGYHSNFMVNSSFLLAEISQVLGQVDDATGLSPGEKFSMFDFLLQQV